MIVTPKEVPFIKILEGQTVGLTSGCFDLLHFYHLYYLQRCKGLCDVLLVGVDSDDLIKHNKKRQPAIPEYQRVAMVEALRCVDAAFTVRHLNDLLLVGNSVDYVFKNSPTIYGQDVILCQSDCPEPPKLVIVEDIQEVQSTTAIKEKIINANT